MTPSNIDDEFVATEGDSYAWLRVDMTAATNRPAAVSIETGTTVPDTPVPSTPGQPPYVTYRAIAKITATADAIIKLEPLVKDSQWVSCVVTGVDNDSGIFTLDLIWTSATDGTAFTDYGAP